MKISEAFPALAQKYPDTLKIIKKWNQWILLEEEAFFMAQFFRMKSSLLDSSTMQVSFSEGSRDRYLERLREYGIGYLLAVKCSKSWRVQAMSQGWSYQVVAPVDREQFLRAKDRLSTLHRVGLEDSAERPFLLQQKYEELYTEYSAILLRLPRRARYFFREKIEKLFLETLDLLYRYKYHIWDRTILIETIFSQTMLLREFHRMLFIRGILDSESTYLDISRRFIEILKICKGMLRDRQESIR